MEINLSELGIAGNVLSNNIQDDNKPKNKDSVNDATKSANLNTGFNFIDGFNSDKRDNISHDNESIKPDSRDDRKNNSKIVKSLATKSPALVNALVNKWSGIPLDDDERELVSYATELLLQKYSAILENTPEGFAIIVIAIIILNRTAFKAKNKQLALAI
jgi:hypothetical protein